MAYIERYKNGRVPTFKSKFRYFIQSQFWIGGRQSSPFLSTRVYLDLIDADGNGLSSLPVNRTTNSQAKSINAIEIDLDRNLYLAFSGNESITLIKINSNGFLIWEKSKFLPLVSQTNSLKIDWNNNIYVGAQRTTTAGTYYNYFKYDTNGNLLWNLDTSGVIFSIAVDANNSYVYTDKNTSRSYLIKYDNDGNEIWQRQVSSNAIPRQVIYDGNGYLYLTHTRPIPQTTLKKYDIDGNLIWSVDTVNDVFAITLGPDGNIYVAGYTTGFVRIYNTSGSLISQFSSVALCQSLYVDTEGNVYMSSNDAYYRKYNKSGVLLWSYLYNGVVLTSKWTKNN